MAIYLVDYENVYIEGLQGIGQLTDADTLHIFYTQNRCGLTFGLYEQLLACKAKVVLNEVAACLKASDPVKNALDLQLTMYAGYLIGAKRSEQLYIVSKDKDFLLGLGFYEQFIHDEHISLQLIPSVEDAFHPEEPEEETDICPESDALEEIARGYDDYGDFVESLQNSLSPSLAEICNRYAKPAQTDIPVMNEPVGEAPLYTVQYFNTVRNLLGRNTDEDTVNRVCEMITVSDSLVDFNNALTRFYRDGQRAKVVYHKFKPRFEDLRHLSAASVRQHRISSENR